MAIALKLRRSTSTDKRPRLDELRAAIRAAERAVEARRARNARQRSRSLSACSRSCLSSSRPPTQQRASPVRAGPGASARRHGGAVVVPIVTKVGGKILIVTARPDATSPVAHRARPAGADHRPARCADARRGARTAQGRLARRLQHQLSEGEPSWTGAGRNGSPPSTISGPSCGDCSAPARCGPEEAGVKPGARLVWLPTGALGILPLGLAQDPVTKRRLADNYEIVYAPSLEALAAAQKQIAKTAAATLAAIINPTGDLPGTEKEGGSWLRTSPATRARLERRRPRPMPCLLH